MELKLAVPLATIGYVGWDLAAAFNEQINVVLNVAALVAIAGGLLFYGRLKARGDAAMGAADAWRDERDAAVAKSERLEAELSAARVKIATLESRPSLESIESQLETLRRLIEASASAVDTVRASTPPSTPAESVRPSSQS